MSRPSGQHFSGDLRRALVDATVAVIATDGPAAVSLRSVARQLGVSHAAPGKHFRDREDLFTAIATEAFALLDARLAAAGGAEPAQRLRAAVVAYARFALDHPGHFTLMWRPDLYDREDDGLTAAAGRAYAHLADRVAAAQAGGWLADRPHGQVMAHVWAGAHGFTQLWGTSAFAALSDDDWDAGVGQAVDLLLRDGG